MARRKADKQRLREERNARDQAKAEQARRQRRITLGATAGAGLLVVGIVGAAIAIGGGGGSSSGVPAPGLTKTQLAALPKALAQNSDQANQIIDTPITEKLRALRGIPIVVNQWASWCPNCVAEFPLFQRLARDLRGRVAFLGLDSQDDRGAAEEFLGRFPVPYPSIYDESASQAASIGGGRGWPTTIFFNRRGERTYVRQGGYVTAATLRADIERYALEPQG
jgi:thiol-disulfide isomerase/thioredoxin